MMPNYNKEFKVTTKYLFGLLILSPILNSIIMGNEIWHDYYLWSLTVSEEYGTILHITLKDLNKLHLTLYKVHYV